MTNSNISIKSNLIARFILAESIKDATSYAAQHAADRFERFSDDDLDYFPSALAIANRLAMNIEMILIPSDIEPNGCIDLISELANDDDFMMDANTYSTILGYYLPEDEDDDDADRMQNAMVRDAIESIFDTIDLPEGSDLRELPDDLESRIEDAISNIRNAFANAHREVYPNSYSSSQDLYPSTITLNPNPYIKL